MRTNRSPLALAFPVVLLLAPACGGKNVAAKAQNVPPMPTTVASASSTPAVSADQSFEALAQRFLAGYLQRSPVEATSLGDHSHDGAWPDPSEAGDTDFLAFLDASRKDLDALPKDDLSVQNRIDASILKNEVDRVRFVLHDRKLAVYSPYYYTSLIGDGLDGLVSRDFAPLADRMQSAAARLAGIPALLAVAKARLGHPAKVNTETAIKQTKGLIALCETELPGMAAPLPDKGVAVQAAAQAAATALHDYESFLEKDLLARSDGSFRIGEEKLAKTLRFLVDDQVGVDDLANAARTRLADTQDEMAKTSIELWPSLSKAKLPDTSTPAAKKALVKQVLAILATDRSTNASIVGDAKQILADATSFVKAHDLVRVPDEPCEVIEMPEYRRGVAIAYCDSSGPLEKKQQTFVSIAPTPSDWPAARVESFYREYDKSMLTDLIVHEAMPGHYLQAMHANGFSSVLRAVFSNGAFVEGWAVYGEWLMAKYGFGGAPVRLQRLKMLARVCANAILDHDIHAGTLDEKGAIDFMMNEAFQEEGEATGKWNRARLTAGQLSTYFYGFTELMKIREGAEKQPGFSERAYHDKLLSFGAPAVRYLAPLMRSQ